MRNSDAHELTQTLQETLVIEEEGRIRAVDVSIEGQPISSVGR